MITGHRPVDFTPEQKLWTQKTLKQTLSKLKKFHNTKSTLSGLALGADTWWIKASLALSIPYVVYIPFEDQAKDWTLEEQETWRQLRKLASEEKVLGGKEYSVKMFHARNGAMIADSDLTVAVLRSDSKRGGTYSTVAKARAKNKPIIIIDPLTSKITKENMD